VRCNASVLLLFLLVLMLNHRLQSAAGCEGGYGRCIPAVCARSKRTCWAFDVALCTWHIRQGMSLFKKCSRLSSSQQLHILADPIVYAVRLSECRFAGVRSLSCRYYPGMWPLFSGGLLFAQSQTVQVINPSTGAALAAAPRLPRNNYWEYPLSGSQVGRDAVEAACSGSCTVLLSSDTSHSCQRLRLQNKVL
jgi:hypothetical protein